MSQIKPIPRIDTYFSLRIGLPEGLFPVGLPVKILTGKSTRKRSLGDPRRRWEDNVRIYLKELDVNIRNWVDLVQDRDYWRALVNCSIEPPGFMRHEVS